MLLPELQALAGSMGLSTGKLRKSELIAAIESARQPAAPTATSGTAGTAKTNGTTTGAARTTRTRRTASRPAGAAQPTLPDAGAEPVAAQPANSAQPANGTQRFSGPEAVNGSHQADRTEADQSFEPVAAGAPAAERTTGERTSAGRNRADNSGRDGQGQQNRDNQGRDSQGQQNRDNQGQQNRDNQGRDNQGQQNRDGGQNNRNRNQNQSQNQNQQNRDGGNRPQNNNGPDDDDDFGNRRGRRYRDRRGRARERGESGGGRSEVEPTISDDDVLTPVAGILDNVDDKGSWFIRVNGYFATSDDVYVANSHVRRYGLRRGDAVTGVVRQPREGERKEKFNPLVRLDTVNGAEPDSVRNRVEFTKLTPLYPQERLRLETESHILTTRVIDLVMPIGKGQRALIVSPPKAGKTMIMQAIANAIATNNPECHLMVVLIDERPEEVTDMQRSVKGEVIASTFDRRPQDHTMVAELSIERAKRLVEMGHDVVVLLDSITRLGRAYNLAAPASGRILSGGVDSTALYPPKRFLGAARNIEHGGSLTIIASALVETGSAGDTVIFEEFKGTGNAELRLDRKIADKRVFPAVDVD
ncbi:MAG TPA: transcription termination factor Rho, partial [Jatrophihabitans sp.]|nr:transcription termination factor Rho [Jatrophihabitans sp.]